SAEFNGNINQYTFVWRIPCCSEANHGVRKLACASQSGDCQSTLLSCGTQLQISRFSRGQCGPEINGLLPEAKSRSTQAKTCHGRINQHGSAPMKNAFDIPVSRCCHVEREAIPESLIVYQSTLSQP